MRARTRGLGRFLGIACAVVVWLGWFQIAPAIGFPTIGPDAMLNRLFLPRSDPGVWLGWLVMTLGLVLVAGLYALAVGRGWVHAGALSGAVFGLVAWTIAGMILMVVIGHISQPAPAPPAPPGPPLPTTPDPMHATFLMLHLGALAPIEALAAWLLFGSIVGATFATSEPAGAIGPAPSPRGTGMAPAGLVILVAALAAVALAETDATGADRQETGRVTTRILATGPAMVLPDGAAFVSVIELPQAPGASLGPHAHVPGFAYVLRGRETISFAGQPGEELERGRGGFMGALAIHTHENRDRVPAAVLVVLLLVLGLALSLASLSGRAARRAAAILTGLLIVAGALALWDPWANDWFFISVRPEAARGGVMPLPNASRVYESPDLEGTSPGPYTEALRITSIPSGAAFTLAQAPGPEAFVVLDGRGSVRVDGGAPISLRPSQATLVQEGGSVRLSNTGGDVLSVLSFRVVGSGGSQ